MNPTLAQPPGPAALIRRHALRVTGRGDDTIVFVHGFGTDQLVWRFVSPAFEATHRVVLLDLVGCGRSDMAAYGPRYDTLQAYADDLVEVVETLRLRRVTLVGHSIGGVIGLLASVARPALFDRLVMVCSSPRFLDAPPDYVGGFQPADLRAMFDLMKSDHFGWARVLAPMVAGEDGPQALAREFEAALQKLDARVAGRFGALVFNVDCRSDIGRATLPVQVLYCSRDPLAPASVAHYLHAHLRRGSLVCIDAAGHCPQLSHPVQTVDAIRAHLGACAAEPGGS